MRLTLSPAILICLATSLAAHASTISTFNTNNEGWTSARIADFGGPNFSLPVGTNALTYSSTGGNPGGRVSIEDPTDDWQYFLAPAAFLGNKSSSLGLNMTFDLLRLDSFSISPVNPQGPLVAATDGSTVLVYSAPYSVPNTTSWTSYSVALAAGDWRINSTTGTLATASQLATVFGNLTALYISADMFAGAVTEGVPETLALDNVNLPSASNEVPEPSSLALMATGLAAFVWKRRKA